MCFAFLEDPILVALLLPLDEPVWILTLILLMFRLHQHFQSWIHLSTDAVGGRSSLQHVGVRKGNTEGVWNLQHINGMNMGRTVALFYTWGNGWAWTFNVPINFVEVAQTGPQHQLWYATLQTLLYSGLQCLDSMPATAALMKQHLGRQHHLVICNIGQIQVKDIVYNGQKTAERIRCNVDAKTWADSADIGLYNTEIEEHQREGLMDTGIESNMEEDEHDVHQDWSNRGSTTREETATPLDEWNPKSTEMPWTISTECDEVRSTASINVGWIQQKFSVQQMSVFRQTTSLINISLCKVHSEFNS